MEYMGDRQFWDDKFASRGNQPLPPEKALVEHAACFKKGSVLDIACGDGRNSLFLLERGFHVTGIDFSREALKRLEKFARQRNHLVATRPVDLNEPDALAELGTFDNIVINHYRLNKESLARLHSLVSDEGILFVCGFGHAHTHDPTIRPEDLIHPSDFDDVLSHFRLLTYVEEENEIGSIVTYMFCKEKGER